MAGAEVWFYGTIANEPDALRSLCRRLSKDGRPLHFCRPLRLRRAASSDAARTPLRRRGAGADSAQGDKVKTDRRDAMMLAQTLRAGQLTAVWVPDEALMPRCRRRSSLISTPPMTRCTVTRRAGSSTATTTAGATCRSTSSARPASAGGEAPAREHRRRGRSPRRGGASRRPHPPALAEGAHSLACQLRALPAKS